MAEIVQRHSENMARELEDIRQTKLLSEDMIRRILIARKHMEARIFTNFSKNIEDYKQYIAHETLILEKVRKCRDKKKISEKKSSVDYSIIKRIRRLYETALQRFPSDYSLHEGFFKFCKESSFNSTASQAIDNMIKLFSYRPHVWKLAASWYCHINDVDRALQTLHKGLTLNRESTLLYSTAIEMELNQVTNGECTPEEKSFKENKCSEKIKTYVNLILANVKNLEYIISTLAIIEGHSYTSPAQNMILEYLFKNHATEDIVWDMMAKREKKGMHFVSDPNEKPRSSSFTKSCLTYCVDKYLQGLSLVAPEKKMKLWSHYLETLISINEESHKSAHLSRVDLLRNALEQAHAEKCLEERHYNVWVGIISDDEARKILEEATEIYPKSEELWKTRLRYAIITDKVKEVNVTFYLGEMELKERALSLWLMVLRFHLLTSDNETIKGIFKDGIKKDPEISNVLKPKYIEWVAFHEGMKAAREEYRALAVQTPYCKQLHLLMSKLELTEMTIDYDSWEQVHELACAQFGAEDIDVGINYIKFILFRKPEKFQEKIERIYNEAKERLPALLWQQFKELYEKLLEES